LFFCWFAKNKRFDPKKGLSGQIFPFLLICIAALIVAAGVAVSAGKSAINKTRVSNAADAGALAAGSGWSAAFNELAVKNEEMQTYYEDERLAYNVLHLAAQSYLDSAISYTKEAERLANEAYLSIMVPLSDCEEWPQFSTASSINGLQSGWIWEEYFSNEEKDFDFIPILGTASGEAFFAKEYLLAFVILTYYMETLSSNFKSGQLGNYCGARNLMDKSIVQAKKAGIIYAFSNSGTSARAPDGDAFSFWLGTDQYQDKSTFGDTTTDSTYKWQWDSKCGTSECGTTVNFEMPILTAYKIKHAKWNYPEDKTLSFPSAIKDLWDNLLIIDFTNLDLSEDYFNFTGSLVLAEIMLPISFFLAENALISKKIYDLSVEGKACCDAATTDEERAACVTTYYTPAYKLWNTDRIPDDSVENDGGLFNVQGLVSNALSALIKEDASYLSAFALKSLDNDIYNNMWQSVAAAEGNAFLSDTDTLCADMQGVFLTDDVDEILEIRADASADEGDSTLEIQDVPMIVSLGDDPEFEGPPAAWQVKCSVTSFCSNIYSEHYDNCSGSASTSTSTAEFQGEGELKSFTDEYNTEIIAVS
jgi:flagellar basal body-associated protein FliL